MVLLLTSLVATTYVTVVVHRYLAVLAAGAFQVPYEAPILPPYIISCTTL